MLSGARRGTQVMGAAAVPVGASISPRRLFLDVADERDLLSFEAAEGGVGRPEAGADGGRVTVRAH